MKVASVAPLLLSLGLLVAPVSHADAAEAAPAARVHMEGAPGLGLEALAPGSTVWTFVCRAPCDRSLPIDALYRVTGAGLEGSKAFRLEASAGGYALLDVKPTTKSAHTKGTVIAVAGGAAIAAGLASILAYAIVGAGDSLCNDLDQPGSLGGCATSNQSPPRGLLIGGIVTAVIGGIVLVTGISVAQPTAVLQSQPPRERDEENEEPSRPRDRRWTRLPTWAAPSTALALPAANTVTLFTTTF